MEPLLQEAAAIWSRWDDAVSGVVFDGLYKAGVREIRESPSPITADLPLVASPTPLVTSMLAYLVIVCTSVAYQTAFPKKAVSDPAWLRSLVKAHNLVLIVLSAYMCGSASYNAWALGYNFWGQGYDPQEVSMGITVYIFYVSKLYEFMDTFIMLLKGKINQVSFLHVYHHATISAYWWIIAYVAPGGDPWYCVMLNSLVHVLMYTYYLVAAALGKDEQKKRKYLWWGRYLTMFQMSQFVSMMAQSVYCYYFSPYPRSITAGLFWYMITLLALFGNFFMRKHGGKGKSRKQE